MTVNGLHVGLGFVVLLVLFVAGAAKSSWRGERARIQEARKPAVPPIDYERLHYGAAFQDFQEKETRRV